MTSEPTPHETPDARLGRLVQLFKQFADITCTIQTDMSLALLQDERIKKDLGEQMQWDENKVQQRIDKVVRAFIGVMPIASLHGSNLFMSTLGVHGNLCSGSEMHAIIDSINEILMDED